MEFWGIEVKGKEATKVEVEDFHLLHLSQAVLGDVKKDGEPVTLYVKVGDKKLVLGIMSANTNPQLSFDLVFEKDFEISHNAKNGSVHFLGYTSEQSMDDEIFSDPSDDDEDEDVPILQTRKEEAVVKAVVPTKAIAAKPTKNDTPKVEAKVEDDDDDEDSDDDSDEQMVDMSDDSDDDDEEDSSEEEETPVKVEIGKKRKPEAKTPESKKAKQATPQKTDGKKSAHTATPYPSKKGAKTPQGADKSTPKQASAGIKKSGNKAKNSGGK